MKQKKEEDYAFDVDGNLTMKYSESDLKDLDVIEVGDNSYSILYHNKVYNVQILKYSQENQCLEVKVNGDTYKVDYKTPLDELIDKLGLDEVPMPDSMDVLSPMPGMVMELSVSEGDKVERGDNLLILEAMKMENAIVAEMDGVISKIEVSEDDSVEKGTLLMVIENQDKTEEE